MNTHCLVLFSIGKRYFDGVRCNVVSMNACHLWLDKPWKYNRNAIYDGQYHIYTSNKKKKQKRIVLAPKKEEVVAKSKGKSMLFLSRIIEKGK